MQLRNMKFDTSFFLGAVYFFIALATFKHTMWAGSTVFEGAYPAEPAEQAWWWITGVLVAVGIDVGMMTAAHVLTKPKGTMKAFVFTLAFIVAALASLFTQIMYSSAHTAEFEFGPGVTAYWRGFLQPLIDARPVLMAAFLPLFAIVYTMARITVHEKPKMETPVEEPLKIGIPEQLMVPATATPKSRRRLGGKIAVAAQQLNGKSAESTVTIPDGELVTLHAGSDEPFK